MLWKIALLLRKDKYPAIVVCILVAIFVVQNASDPLRINNLSLQINNENIEQLIQYKKHR